MATEKTTASIHFDTRQLYNQLLERAKKRVSAKIKENKILDLSCLEMDTSKSKNIASEVKLEEKQVLALKTSIADLTKIIQILTEDNSKKLKPILSGILKLVKEVASDKKIEEDKNVKSKIFEMGDSDFKQLRGMIVAAEALGVIADIYSINLPNIKSFVSELNDKYQSADMRCEVPMLMY